MGSMVWNHSVRLLFVAIFHNVRAHLHQASKSTLRQLCDDANYTALIENNGASRNWVATPFWSNSIVFNKSGIASIIVELSQH